MFCPKCGNKIKAGEEICSLCGADINSEESILEEIINKLGIPKFVDSVKNNEILKNISFVLGVNSIQYLICVASMFFTGFMTFFVDFKVIASAFGLSKTESIEDGGLFTIMALFGIFAAVIASLPFFMKRKVKKWNFSPAKFIFTVEFILMVILHISANREASSAALDLARVSLNFAGWMFYVFSVVSVILSYVITKKLPKRKRKSLIKRFINSYADIKTDEE